MMTPADLNSIGLILDILGALMMFFNSQKVSYSTIIHSDVETNRLYKKAIFKNKIAKAGAVILACGFALQLISNYI